MPGGLSRRALIVLLVFMLAAWFGTLDYRKLVKPDEGRYAEIPREMLASGDWLTPRLNGIKYFEKPPLQYWTTATAFKVFGLHAWSARLWTALCGFATVLLVWWGGRRLFGAAAGDFAAMVLASNVFFVVLGHVNTLDMSLTAFTTLALVGFCLAQRASTAEHERRRWMLVVWAAMAFAVLSKGLVGLVLPALTLFAHMALSREWHLWRRIALIPGLVVFALIALPWFLAVSVANPEFAWFFFIEQHVLRYATDVGRREGPLYYFVVVLLAGMLPWTLVMLDTVRAEAKSAGRAGRAEPAAQILFLWVAVVFIFFTLSRSKLPAYVLPMFPALALLMGKRMAELSAIQLHRRVLPLAPAALAGGVLVFFAPQLAGDPVLRPLAERYTYWLYAALAATVAGMALLWLFAASGRKVAAVTALSSCALIASLLALNGHDTFAPSLSAHALAEKLRPIVPRDAPFYSVRTYEQTLPFYLQRTFTLVEFRDELHYGLLQEPQLAVHDFEQFRARWAAHARAFALTTPEHFEALRRSGLAMQLVADDGRRIVVRKPESGP